MRISLPRLPLLLALLASLTASHAATSAKPNFLMILTDDLGYADVSTNGQRDVSTPNMDRIAQEGMLFTHMRANATVCSPTRAAFMTGVYADRAGVPGLIRTAPENTWGYLSAATPTLAERLKPAGYKTAAIGKWNLGLQSPNLPNDRGFDFYHGFLDDMMDNYMTHRRMNRNYMRLNRDTIDPQGHATDIFTGWAIEYLQERAKDKAPFFLYLAYNAPHAPIEPPAEWLARVQKRDPKLDEKRAKIVALIEHLDDGIGKVMAALKAGGLDENTVVVFTSDNGGSLPHGSVNLPMRDGKQSHYEGGLRIPFAVRWPAGVKAGSRSDYAGLTFDANATFLDLAGIQTPKEYDAVSLLPILRGGAPAAAERELYFVRREGGPAYGGKSYEAIIRGDWKLMQNDPYSPLELYNLKDDPEEKNNLIKKEPKIVRELETALRAHIQRGGETPWQKPTS